MFKTRRLQVLITDEQWRRLEALAAQRGVSVATIVREAIDVSVPGEPGARRRAAQAILGADPMPVGDPDELRAELDAVRGRHR